VQIGRQADLESNLIAPTPESTAAIPDTTAALNDPAVFTPAIEPAQAGMQETAAFDVTTTITGSNAQTGTEMPAGDIGAAVPADTTTTTASTTIPQDIPGINPVQAEIYDLRARLKQRQEFEEQVHAANAEVLEALQEWEDAKALAAGRKKTYDEKVTYLTGLISRGQTPTPLFDQAASPAPASAASTQANPSAELPDPNISQGTTEPPAGTPLTQDEARKAYADAWQAILNEPIEKLDLPESIKEKIAEHGPDQIKTVADLCKIKETNPVKGFTIIKGIGEGKAEKIDQAIDKHYADNQNRLPPNPDAPPAAAEAPASASPHKWDFETTFPPNLKDTSSDHREWQLGMINDQVAITEKIAKLKHCIDKECAVYDATRDLTTDEVLILKGDLVKDCEELEANWKSYGDDYGDEAVTALEAHVQKLATADAKPLAGGLESTQ